MRASAGNRARMLRRSSMVTGSRTPCPAATGHRRRRRRSLRRPGVHVPSGRQLGGRPGGVGAPVLPIPIEGWLPRDDAIDGSGAPVAEPGSLLRREQAIANRLHQLLLVLPFPGRSEERRVGKEGRTLGTLVR